MANEIAVNKKRIRMNVPLVLARKVEKTFGKANDKALSSAYIRALEEVTRKIILTKADYDAIGKQVDANMNSRMARRKERAAGKGRAVSGPTKGARASGRMSASTASHKVAGGSAAGARRK